MNILNSTHFKLLERSLDAAALRQKVTANNIANVDTPNFKRSDVLFEQLLMGQMNQYQLSGKRTHNKHLPIGTYGIRQDPEVVEDLSSVMNNNLNNVDMDSEMTGMAKNQLRYNVLVQQLNHDIRNLRTAIEGRKS